MTTLLVDPAALNERLQVILDGAAACLEENTALGAPPEVFIAHTRPPDDCGDLLAIWLDRLHPTRAFPAVDGLPMECGSVTSFARVMMKLARSCYPVVQDSPSNPFPGGPEVQSAAESLLVDANVLWCCLVGSMDGAMRGPDELWSFRVESLIPDQPRGGVAGLTVTMQIELEPCC